MGKSRLVADFLERVGAEAEVLRGRCLSYGEEITYWPLVEMLVPLGIEPENVVGSTPAETRVAFRKLLEARAVERPQVVVVDDLQWAAPEFVDLVEHVADLSRDAPIFLLCIARTELLDARPGWSGGKLNATSLLLEPLGVDECEVADRQPARRPRARHRRARAHRRGLGWERALRRGDGGHGARAATATATSRCLPTISALLQARIDSLDGELRLVLERAAIEGEVFHVGAVAELSSDSARPALDEHLAALVRKDLVRPEPSLISGQDAYRFRHLLIREAAYATMPKELRAQLHERYAEWLERTADESAFELDEIVGYHLEQALVLRQELGIRDEELAVAGGAAASALRGGGLSVAPICPRPPACSSGAASTCGADDDATRLRGDVRPRRGSSSGGVSSSGVDSQPARDDRARACGRRPAGSSPGRDSPTIRSAYASTSDATVEDELARAVEIAASLEGSDELAALVTAHTEIGMCKFQLGRAGEGEVDLERAAELARRVGRRRASSRGDGIAAATGGLGPDARVRWRRSLRGTPLRRGCERGAQGAGAPDSRAASARCSATSSRHVVAAADAWACIEEFDLAPAPRASTRADVGVGELIGSRISIARSRCCAAAHDVLVEIGDVGVRSTVDAIFADVLVHRGPSR